MLINELAQELVSVEVGELQLTPVISTGYGFGLVISKYTGPAGPPGKIDAPAPAGVSGITVSDCATLAAPVPDPEPDTLQNANAVPVPIPTAAVATATPISNLFILMAILRCLSLSACGFCG
jgi:hypothetical protein